MDDMDAAEAQKRNKSFFYHLVRPWKWGRRFKKKGRQGGMCACVYAYCRFVRGVCVRAWVLNGRWDVFSLAVYTATERETKEMSLLSEAL